MAHDVFIGLDNTAAQVGNSLPELGRGDVFLGRWAAYLFKSPMAVESSESDRAGRIERVASRIERVAGRIE